MRSQMDELVLAEAEYRAQRFGVCVKFSEYALARDPDSFEALNLLGLSLLELNQTERGIDALEHAGLLAPLSAKSRISLAMAYGEAGRTELSKDLLMLLATSESLGEQEFLQVAAGLAAINEPRLALEACRRAGEICPLSAEVHYHMSAYAVCCSYPEDVIEALIRKAVHLDPENVEYRVGLALLLARLERIAEAVSVADSVVPSGLDSLRCCSCLTRLANLYFDTDNFGQSKLCSERIRDLQNVVASERRVLQ